jgi:deoxyribodipyrimidine photolyase
MQELRTTGYCSNRVRQNAASVLTKDLGLDWRAGAEWYQFLLEDHCVGANWGNWMYFAGVGSDPKQRHFRTVSQAKRYDPTGSYVSQWIPELAPLVSATMKHQPWNVLEDWGPTIVDVKTQDTWQDLLEAEAIVVGEEYAKQQQLGEEHQSFNT